MLLNQLQQLGAPNHEALPARWQQILDKANAERALRGLLLLEFVVTNTLVPAYVNRGAWVADCADRNCNGGIAVSPDWALCCCLDCGRIYVPLVPDDVVIAAATVLLERRPAQNQNWVPAREPIKVLQAENYVHGYDTTLAEDLDMGRMLLPAAMEQRSPALHAGNLNLALTEGGQ